MNHVSSERHPIKLLMDHHSWLQIPFYLYPPAFQSVVDPLPLSYFPSSPSPLQFPSSTQLQQSTPQALNCPGQGKAQYKSPESFPKMSGGQLLGIQPSELKFPFELKKHSYCTLELTNNTDQYVAFKVKTTNPKKYFVRPNMGIVMPNAKSEVSVTMQAQEEAPADMQCKDKFLLQSVVTSFGVTTKDITPDMFDKEAGRVVEEFKLRVIYIPANFPPHVLEGSEMGSSPSMQDNQSAFLFDAVSRSNEEAKLAQASKTFGQLEETSGAWLTISRLTEEKNSAFQQNQMLHQEMELLRKEMSRKKSAGFSFMFILLVGLASVLIGYLVKM